MNDASYFILDPIDENEEQSGGKPRRLLYEYSVDDAVRSVLDLMTPREAQIMRLRIGMDGESPRTREEVAEMLGVSCERIRMVENKALRKYHASRRRNYSGYLC